MAFLKERWIWILVWISIERVRMDGLERATRLEVEYGWTEWWNLGINTYTLGNSHIAVRNFS